MQPAIELEAKIGACYSERLAVQQDYNHPFYTGNIEAKLDLHTLKSNMDITVAAIEITIISLQNL